MEAVASLPKPAFSAARLGKPDAAKARKETRSVYLHERKAFAKVPVYAGDLLRPGHRLAGPALVEAEDMTVLVRSGHPLGCV